MSFLGGRFLFLFVVASDVQLVERRMRTKFFCKQSFSHALIQSTSHSVNHILFSFYFRASVKSKAQEVSCGNALFVFVHIANAVILARRTRSDFTYEHRREERYAVNTNTSSFFAISQRGVEILAKVDTRAVGSAGSHEARVAEHAQ